MADTAVYRAGTTAPVNIAVVKCVRPSPIPKLAPPIENP